MDTTNVFAVMAAITATSVVAFEYLRYSERRLEAQATPIAAVPEQSKEREVRVDQSVNNDQAPEIDLSAQRQSLVSRSKEDQLCFRKKLTMKYYELHCSCDQHAQNVYFNWPYSCLIKHSKDDILVEAGARPTLVSEFGEGPYEALTFAYRTIKYFTREKKEMDPSNSMRSTVPGYVRNAVVCWTC
jgi:hypothetical protein